MDQRTALAVFDCLSAGVRLDAFRLLVQAEPNGLVAGELAAALEVAPSSLSFHLRTLSQSGLVTAAQEGRFLRYRANLALMLEVIRYLTENCCGGRPEACATLAAGLAACAPARPTAPDEP